MNSERAVAQWTKLSLNYFIKSERKAMERANEAGSSIEAAQSWRKAVIPLATPFLIKTLFWKYIQGGVKRQGKLQIWRKNFYELDEFVEFYTRALGKFPRIVTGDGGEQLVTFTAPYGYVNTSVTKESTKCYENFFSNNLMEVIYFNCEVEGGAEQLSATGANAKQFLVFVLEQKDGKIAGKTCTFMKVVYPHNEAKKKVTQMNGVSLKGEVGWIPTTSLTQAYCRCPAVSFIADEAEAHQFMYLFKAHQAKNGMLQWRAASHTEPVDEDLAIAVPHNFSVWDGNQSTISLDAGELVDYDVMFKFLGGWMHVRLLRFYPVSVRSLTRPYNYEAQFMDGSRQKIDIQFKLQNYSSEVDAPVSSWCIIRDD